MLAGVRFGFACVPLEVNHVSNAFRIGLIVGNEFGSWNVRKTQEVALSLALMDPDPFFPFFPTFFPNTAPLWGRGLVFRCVRGIGSALSQWLGDF